MATRELQSGAPGNILGWPDELKFTITHQLNSAVLCRFAGLVPTGSFCLFLRNVLRETDYYSGKKKYFNN
jgi:hypothetical protein